MRLGPSLHLIAVASLVMCCLGGAVARAQSPLVGVWEHRMPNAAGPPPLLVMEIRGDGTYSVNGAVAYRNDRGHYAVAGDTLTFTSAVKQRNSRQAKFAVDADGKLVLSLIAPFPGREEWTSRQVAPLFATVEVDGRRIPTDLSTIALLALHNVAKPWRRDAIPVWLTIDEQQSSDYRIALGFVSPADGSGLQLWIELFDVKTMYLKSVRWGRAAYPPQFVDLVPVLEAARASGMTGALRQAELRVWDQYGPVWRLFPHGPAGRQYSAVDGREIRGDVSGYVADYNRQWNEALAGIGALANTAAAFFGPWGSMGEQSELDKAKMNSCVARGGQWSMGQKACN